MAQLDDVFAKVGLDRRNAVFFEMIVDADLLGDHRFALGDALSAGGAADRQYLIARLGGIGGPMHLAAERRHIALEGLEIKIEMRQHVILDVATFIAQLFEFGEPRHRGAAPAGEVTLQDA